MGMALERAPRIDARVDAASASILAAHGGRHRSGLKASATASNIKKPQRAVAVTAKLALRGLLGLDLRVEGAGRLPKDPHIVAHNLVSPLDAFVVALALTEAGHAPPVILLDYELRDIPLLSGLLRAGALSVDRSVGEEGDGDPFGVATRALWADRCVIAAPEQVVSESLEVLPVRSGPLRLGVATDSALVPTAVFGAHRLFDPADGRMKLRRRGAAVNVVFGQPTPPPTSTEELASAQRMLQFDLEALLGQALDDYPDREAGEAGAWWWPERRGGSAPSLLDTLDDVDAPTPTIELWADDRTVGDTRRALDSSTTTAAPEVAMFVIEDDDEPEAAGPSIECDRTYVRPRLPEPEPLPATAPERVVDGMLAFDLPGLPRKVLRRARLEVAGTGRLAVYVGDVAVLGDVKVDRRADKTLFTGKLSAQYRVASGDLVIEVPEGTKATLVALDGDA